MAASRAPLCILQTVGDFVIHDSEPVDDNNTARSHNNYTYQDGQGNHVALVLPIDKLAGRTTTAKKGMGIHSLTMATWSCDRSEH